LKTSMFPAGVEAAQPVHAGVPGVQEVQGLGDPQAGARPTRRAPPAVQPDASTEVAHARERHASLLTCCVCTKTALSTAFRAEQRYSKGKHMRSAAVAFVRQYWRARRVIRHSNTLGAHMRRYRPHLTVEVSLAELEGSDEAVGAGPGIDEQRRQAQRDKAEVLLERCVLQHAPQTRRGQGSDDAVPMRTAY